MIDMISQNTPVYKTIASEIFPLYSDLDELDNVVFTNQEKTFEYFSNATNRFWNATSCLRFSSPEDYLLRYHITKQTYIPLPPFLADYFLLTYCIARLATSDERKSSLADDLCFAYRNILKEYNGLIESRQKLKSFLLAIDTGFWLPFAEAAKADLVCRSLYFRKNDYSHMFHPCTLGTYFQLNTKADQKHHVIRSVVPETVFSIEDFFFHEYSTASSLSIEIAACLSEIENAGLAEYILEALKEKLDAIIGSPMLFSRIAVARFYIKEAAGEIDFRSQAFSRELSDTEKKEAVAEAFRRVDTATEGMLCKISIPPKYSELVADKNDSNSDPNISNSTHASESEPEKHTINMSFPTKVKLCKSNGVVIERETRPPGTPPPFKLAIYYVITPPIYSNISALSRDEEKMHLLRKSLSQISGKFDPVNFLKKAANYGPVVFCNTSHTKIDKLLSHVKKGHTRLELPKSCKGYEVKILRKIQMQIWNSSELERNIIFWTDIENYLKLFYEAICDS